MNSSSRFYLQNLQGREVESDEETEMRSSQESIEDEKSSLSEQSSSEEEEEEKQMNGRKHTWSRILNKAMNRHSTQLDELDERSGDSRQEIALIKAQNAMLPVYRKELRKVLLEYLTWMHNFKEDRIFREIMDTKQQFDDAEGFDWKEAMELAVNKRKFLRRTGYHV